VIAIALVPMLEWLERHRMPAPLAALTCVLLFLIAANVALASIVVPAWQWVQRLPESIPQIQHNLEPLIRFYSNLERFVNKTLTNFASAPVRQPETVAGGAAALAARPVHHLGAVGADRDVLRDPGDLFLPLGLDPAAAQRDHPRASFGGAMATARVIQDVVDDTSAYLGTITLINVTLGLIVAGALWMRSACRRR
jgi:predicted PurR-regulated permease PerM